jgi:hypothetical protein
MTQAVLFSLDSFRLDAEDRHWHEYTTAALETWSDVAVEQLGALVADELERRAARSRYYAKGYTPSPDLKALFDEFPPEGAR